TIRRIGGKDEIPIDVTVIATTHRNLSDAVEKGEFRMDLFYRLNAFSVHILPLKERREDIPVLARHFLSSFATKYNKRKLKGFSPEAERLLLSYSWPGNVRELKN
ncbi:MAG: sigma-54-dependent Fis family transcriptional regulator, partial [Gammaproteobacteria bacterium]|nr:sigma-54-dependent Fis family transcriptional regulator [Gammaproteobacteria bacterium]